MVNRSKMNNGIALCLNLLIIVLEIIPIIMMRHVPFKELAVFYTEDSNLFALLASIVMVVAMLRRWKSGETVPRWVRMFRYMATCLLSVTFFTVVFILTPMTGFNFKFMLLEGSSLYLHFLCPVLAMILLVFFEKKPKLPWKSALWALIPTGVYTLVLVPLNILRIVDGPYPFLRVYEQSLAMDFFWFVVMGIGAFLIAYILWGLNRIASRKHWTEEES